MRSYPGPDRSFGNVHVQSLADHALRIAYRVAEVVRRDCFQNHAGRVGFIFSCGGSEFVQALSALKDWEDSEAVQSPPLLDGEFGIATGTGRYRLCAFGSGHEGGRYLECIRRSHSVQRSEGGLEFWRVEPRILEAPRASEIGGVPGRAVGVSSNYAGSFPVRSPSVPLPFSVRCPTVLRPFPWGGDSVRRYGVCGSLAG